MGADGVVVSAGSWATANGLKPLNAIQTPKENSQAAIGRVAKDIDETWAQAPNSVLRSRKRAVSERRSGRSSG
jgi:hypothetical protein